ncbi:peptidase M4 family protein [Paenibacillus oralis]|uniref:Neutral metalloproteinase n=1 Tax=Paenibacillus oralis TaxID=2490856 RepID=A0A3P3U902_9BACL|nr:M4 family metallopeptidase [Paenibacillus oralis]RRJ66039.1 peptidase M4 family protein [Paenibacillus oralis]
MKKHSCTPACTCHVIPQFILENLSKAGVDASLQSLHQSKMIRQERREETGKTNVAEIAMQAPHAHEANRLVYDCEHGTQLRKKLVRQEGDSASSDSVVNDVYEMIGKVREYYKNVMLRNSIDAKGMDLIINVHYGQKYMNAFWNGSEMVFGDGDGTIFSNFTNSLDVIAHELAHAVTQYTANLEYYGQSGALNEHFSDVFGSAIQQHVKGQTAHDADWLIGNELMAKELQGEALRSMKAPGTAYDNKLMGKDPQPDHLSKYYIGADDNQGVHINSGIPNKAFYLVSMEIGTDKAALIWYKALSRLWPNASFKDAVEVIVDTARKLTNEQILSLGTTQIVRAAFKEVGMNEGATGIWSANSNAAAASIVKPELVLI